MAERPERSNLTRLFMELIELYDAVEMVADGEQNIDSAVDVVDELVDVIYFAGRALGADGDPRFATIVAAAAAAKWEARVTRGKDKAHERFIIAQLFAVDKTVAQSCFYLNSKHFYERKS